MDFMYKIVLRIKWEYVCNQSIRNIIKHLLHISHYHYHYYQVTLNQYDHKVLRQVLWELSQSHTANHELLLRKWKEVIVYLTPYKEDFLQKKG